MVYPRPSERNVFLEVSCTSETEQEGGGALDPQRLTRIRSRAPQTKTPLLEEEEEEEEFCSVPTLDSYDDFDSALLFVYSLRPGVEWLQMYLKMWVKLKN